MHPEIADKNQQQMLAYREIADDDLFTFQWVKVDLPPEEFPGYKGERVVCEACGEGINFAERSAHRRSKCCAAPAPGRGVRYSATQANLGCLLIGVRQAQNRRLIKVLSENLQSDGQRLASRRTEPKFLECPPDLR
jgi:hypothetical protein